MLLLAALGFVVTVVLVAVALTDGSEERAEVRESLRLLGGTGEDRRSMLLAPLSSRAVAPVRRRIAAVGRRFTPAAYVESSRRKLTAAGRPTPDDLDRFMVLRVASVVAIPLLGALVVGFGPDGVAAVTSLLLVSFACLVAPDAFLNRRIRQRAQAIRVMLPDVLDLLIISVEAGLGFEQALDRTAAAVPGPLADEFTRMLGEVRAGARRSDALRAMEGRVDVPELRSFVLAILQADTFGVSIGRVLRAQADEARVKRRQLAEELAQKAPVKMLIPMVFCIFPALFVVVVGPAVVNIARAL